MLYPNAACCERRYILKVYIYTFDIHYNVWIAFIEAKLYNEKIELFPTVKSVWETKTEIQFLYFWEEHYFFEITFHLWWR